MKKMKVKYAAQILSQRLASTMLMVNNMEGQTVLENGNYTAEILYFFDRLFDSVNGSNKQAKKGKSLRSGISGTSAHLDFWTKEALPFLKEMKFIKPETRTTERPPPLKNWSFTITNIINIWSVLKNDGFANYLEGTLITIQSKIFLAKLEATMCKIAIQPSTLLSVHI
ncbi:cleavage stimulation factor subunit 2 [Holotrichia oblita]|uniref:Cleavage stimulation factor subunit 2 n=1 Tax=Holotrichia oblita TaxID=644536 RepID=A0ACB9SXW0_HOLOL|nr:cleavage stimulation factor subunit 2 [Holotrichia oblita]